MPVHHGVAIQPCLQVDAERAEGPLIVETYPRAHGELVSVEHHVAVCLEQLEDAGLDALAAILLAQVEVPVAGIVEVKKRLHPAVNIDQFAGAVVLVARV
ncbi:MAG TPA: hypothetical protein VF043_16770 [Ktedonobacteraceae bacterium]